MKVPFNRPYMSGRELKYIAQAHAQGHLAGDGPFTKKCQAWLARRTQASRAFLTHSCTAALEMSAILAGVGKGDEVIVPSFAFVSTANAFVLRGAVPVFTDVRADTLNIDERKIEGAITKKTRAIALVHYGGVACEMDAILKIAKKNHLLVIEDAAQGILCSYKGRPLGTMGDMGAFSFHETKSIISGEGGALLLRDSRFAARAEVIREKGTDRSRFLRGQVDKYTWRDIGSSYLPSDIIAAFLWAQLESADRIVKKRQILWRQYHEAFADLEKKGKLLRPQVPSYCRHNAHLYPLILPTTASRDRFIREAARRGLHAVFHYLPLHQSPAGKKFGRASGALPVSEAASARLVRLPLWLGMEKQMPRILDEIRHLLS